MGPVLAYTVGNDLNENTEGRLTRTWERETVLNDKNPDF